MALLSDEDSKQLEMYRRVKQLLEEGRITLLQSSDTTDGTTLSIELTKSGKSIKKIRSEIDNTSYYR